MKICAIICEFNPFHNGHKHLLESAKVLSGCDAVLCIMSGNFTQRGDIAVLDKYTRARHAVMGGADAVLELPAAFSVAPAEIFAKGAIKILSSIPEVGSLAFGCETPDADFSAAAKLLLKEQKPFKNILSQKLAQGESYVKSYVAAFAACGGKAELLSQPNNILGVEYAKAILSSGAKINLIPVKRVGQNFGSAELTDNYSSAQAIRNNIGSEKIKSNVPPYVYADLRDFSAENAKFEDILRFKLCTSAPETLAKIFGCTEGLENKLAACYNLPYKQLVLSASGKRYTESRIKRILTADLLELYSADCISYLNSRLYIRPLALKKDRADDVLAALSKSEFPLLLKYRDVVRLNNTARKCLESDFLAEKIRNFIFNLPYKEFGYPVFI